MNAEDQDPAGGGALDLDALDGLLVAPGWNSRGAAPADPGGDRVVEEPASDPLHVAPPPVELELPRARRPEPTPARPSRHPPRVVFTLDPAPVAEPSAVAAVAAVAPAVPPSAPVAPVARGTRPGLAIAAAAAVGLVLIAGILWPAPSAPISEPSPAQPPAAVSPAVNATPVAAAPAVVAAAPAAETPPPTDWVVHFGYNQIAPEAGLTPPAALLACAGLEVTGYTCDRGTAESNARLGRARADAVVGLLVAAGYPADRVRARSAGAADPAADNQSAQGRRENRRARVRCLLEPTRPSTGPE